MANTTFSGPVRSGTVREGANANLGGCVLSQTAAFTFEDTGSFASGIILPAGSQILTIWVDLYTTWDSATSDALEIGTQADPDAFGDRADLQSGGRTLATADVTQCANSEDIGDVDVPVYLTVNSAGGSLSKGSARVSVVYRQFMVADSLG